MQSDIDQALYSAESFQFKVVQWEGQTSPGVGSYEREHCYSPTVPGKPEGFRHVIEQKSIHKRTDKALAHSLKTIGTSGSYRLFVEVNQETTSKPVPVKVFSGEIERERPDSVVEHAGRWYFPPVASLITAGGRLLLAMLEKSVVKAGGAYLVCDTDSLCIVSSEHGGPITVPWRKGGKKESTGWRMTVMGSRLFGGRKSKISPRNSTASTHTIPTSYMTC
jgi:hypothetical protein